MSGKRTITNIANRTQNSQQSQKTSRKRTLVTSEESQEVQFRNITDSANNVVRYIITVGGSNVPIKRSDIVKACMPGNAPRANVIFKKAKAILNDVYGYELLNCESKHQTMFVVRNALQCLEEDNLLSNEHDKVLKFLVLNHIFLSGGTSTDASLFAFLQSCKIDPHTLHPIYGNIMEFLNTRMAKEKLITVHVHDETRKVTYTWGPNAEVTVSKMEMLKHFASFGNKNIKSWRTLYEDAKEQFEDENDGENAENSN